MRIIHLNEIKSALQSIDIISEVEKSFVTYSQGKAVIPPVGELFFERPPGEVHIKYGYVIDDEYYVIKIASDFYENGAFGLPTSNGLMLLFSQKTGEPVAMLLDEGYLTHLRTAAASAIVAKYLAPKNVHKIGIIGTGTQAELQLLFLQNIVNCKNVLVWGRSEEGLVDFQTKLSKQGFQIRTTKNIADITQTCNFIITTTPSKQPLLNVAQFPHSMRVHITAVGADTADKQELDVNLLQRANFLVADSVAQCLERGEIAHALRANVIKSENILELGNIIANKMRPRNSDAELTIADLTGIAVQDIALAVAVYKKLTRVNEIA